jgi:hypothetical protein
VPANSNTQNYEKIAAKLAYFYSQNRLAEVTKLADVFLNVRNQAMANIQLCTLHCVASYNVHHWNYGLRFGVP